MKVTKNNMENTSITTKYARKSLFVDAVQVTEDNFEDVARWCFGEIHNVDESTVTEINPEKQYIRVRVQNPKNPRQTKAFVSDWILYAERGCKVYTNKAFQDNFELVQTEVDTPKVEDIKTNDE